MNQTKEEFSKLIIKNLEQNGFPEKSVALPLEKLYESADNKGLNLNDILTELESTHQISNSKETERIVFSKASVVQEDNPFAGMDGQDLMKKAQEMMSKMSPEEMAKIKEQYENMDPSQKESLMQQGKKMGLF